MRSTLKIVQYMNPDIDIKKSYQDCMDQVKSNKPIDVQYELIRNHSYKTDHLLHDCRYESDLFRLHYAVDNPNMVWLDSDIKIREWFTPKDNKAYFFNVMGFPLECAFYVNGQTELFKQLLDLYYSSDRFKHIGWIRSALTSMDNQNWKLIPVDCFEHLYFRGLKDI